MPKTLFLNAAPNNSFWFLDVQNYSSVTARIIKGALHQFNTQSLIYLLQGVLLACEYSRIMSSVALKGDFQSLDDPDNVIVIIGVILTRAWHLLNL